MDMDIQILVKSEEKSLHHLEISTHQMLFIKHQESVQLLLNPLPLSTINQLSPAKELITFKEHQLPLKFISNQLNK
jgi:hypothetical protein